MSGPLSAGVMCTVSDVPPKLSFENVIQGVLLTSRGGEGFPRTGRNGLNQRLLKLNRAETPADALNLDLQYNLLNRRGFTALQHRLLLYIRS